MKWKMLSVVALYLAVLLVSAPSVSAAELMIPSKDSGNVIAGGREFSDLYIFGGGVSILSDIMGDLIAAGGAVTVSGAVAGDVFGGGGDVNIFQPVGGDVRIAGGNVTINTTVGEDVLAAGGTVTFTPESRIGGDLWTAGGSVVVNGEVVGGARIAAGEVFINGTISGPVEIHAEKLVFGSGSNVAGAIQYKGKQAAVVMDGATVGPIEFREYERKGDGKGMFAGLITIALLVKLIAMLIAALLLLKFFGRSVDQITATAHKSPWSSLGVGAAGFFLIPILIIISFVSIVGYYLGLILLAAFALELLLTAVAAGIFTGRVLFTWIRKTPALVRADWKVAIVGVLVYGLLCLIPIVGWIAGCGIFLMTFGSAILAIRDMSQSGKA